MQLKLFFCLCLLSYKIFSQDKIEWQEPIKVSQNLSSILKTTETEYFTIGYNNTGLVNTTHYISYFKNNQLQESQIIQESENLHYIDAIINNNSVYIFFEENKGQLHIFYAQKYDQSCNPIGDLIKLSEVNGDFGKLKYKTFYSFSQSKNKQFFCVDYQLRDTHSESYGYKIFSNDFKIISQGQQQLPYLSYESIIIAKHLTNSGKYFLVVNVFDEPDNSTYYLTSLSQKKVVLHEVSNSGLSEGYDLTIVDNRISDIIINSDSKDILTLSGLYIEKAHLVPNVMGYFCKRINTQMSASIFSHVEKIDQALIMSDLSKELAKERKNSKSILKFKNREILFLPDSSILLIIEQAKTSIVSQSTTTGYSYNELFIFKINRDGEIDWLLKIPKSEHTTFNESISTHFSIIKEEEIVLFFRDHVESYDSTGLWNKSNLYISSDYANTYKMVRIAKVSINLESGEVERKIFLDEPKTELLPIPHLFRIDELNKTMLIVMDNPFGKGEQYGTIHY